MERIGLLPEQCQGLLLDDARLTSKFKNKLNALRDFAYQTIHQWRARLNERGLIAWPLRPTGKINPQDRDLLLQAWTLFLFKEPTLSGLNDLESRHDIDAEDIASLMQRLALPSKLLSLGFKKEEHAGLFADLTNPQQAQANLPHFLARIANPANTQEWTLEKARRDWYWGYLQYASVPPRTCLMTGCGGAVNCICCSYKMPPQQKPHGKACHGPNWITPSTRRKTGLTATVPTVTRLWLPSWSVSSAMTEFRGSLLLWVSHPLALKRWKRMS
ncbi:hypothetical protein QZH46_18830 [Pseudomonas corrugata]